MTLSPYRYAVLLNNNADKNCGLKNSVQPRYLFPTAEVSNGRESREEKRLVCNKLTCQAVYRYYLSAISKGGERAAQGDVVFFVSTPREARSQLALLSHSC